MKRTASVLAATLALGGLATAAAQATPPGSGHPTGDQLNRGSWRSLGPSDIPGDALSLAVHPTVPGLVFVGLRDAGVWRTSDHGRTWVPTSAFQCATPVAIVLDPENPLRLWVAVEGRPDWSWPPQPCGVMSSEDGGRSWRSSTISTTCHIVDLVRAPRTGTLVLATTCDLWRSSDDGVSFAITRHQARWAGLEVVAATSTFLAAGTGDAAGVFRSTDLGQTWVRAGIGNNDPARVGEGRLAVSSDRDRLVYWAAADTAVPPRFLGLWRSTDDGVTFQLIYDATEPHPWDPVALRNGGTMCGLAVDPADPNHLLLGVSGLHESLDGGLSYTATWECANEVAWSSLDPSEVWVAGPSGVAASADGGLTFVGRDSGIVAASVTHVAASAADPNAMIATTTATDIVTDKPPRWHQATTSWPAYIVAIDPHDPLTMYADHGDLLRSTDQGRHWSTLASAYSYSGSHALRIDACDPTTLWWATSSKIFKVSTIDGTIESPPLPFSFFYAMAIAQAPAEPSTLAVLTERGVLVTTSGGVQWMNRGAESLPFGGQGVDMAFDALDPRRLVVTISPGWLGLPSVYLSDNLSGSWYPAGEGLTAESVYTVVSEATPPYRYFAGTDNGVFVSHDRGESWEPLLPRLPLAAVLDLVIPDGSTTLVAATAGRGIWAIALDELPTVD